MTPTHLASVLAVAMLAIGGCHVYAEPAPVTVTSAAYVPTDIEAYPSTVYEGRTVYLYNDNWYYRDRGHWVYYQQPPEPLVRQRTYIQQAPPAHRYPAQPYGNPHYQRPPASAPPATRVQ